MAAPPFPQRSIAITMDDLPFAGLDADLPTIECCMESIIETLLSRKAPCAGFVIGSHLQIENEAERRSRILQTWQSRGFTLGNHTYDHLDICRCPLEAWQDDVLRNDAVLQPFWKERPASERYFRFPFLSTGGSTRRKEGAETFLASHGYRNIPVTFDPRDWLFNDVYLRATIRKDEDTAERVQGAYLQHVEAMAAYLEAFSRRLFRREIPLILLAHANHLNGRQLASVLDLLSRRGYSFISVETALQDPAYSTPDRHTGVWGMNQMYRWAIELEGIPNEDPLSPSKTEPRAPEWILRQYKLSIEPAEGEA